MAVHQSNDIVSLRRINAKATTECLAEQARFFVLLGDKLHDCRRRGRSDGQGGDLGHCAGGQYFGPDGPGEANGKPALAKVDAYNVEGSKMNLLDKEGEIVMSFVAAKPSIGKDY